MEYLQPYLKPMAAFLFTICLLVCLDAFWRQYKEHHKPGVYDVLFFTHGTLMLSGVGYLVLIAYYLSVKTMVLALLIYLTIRWLFSLTAGNEDGDDIFWAGIDFDIDD